MANSFASFFRSFIPGYRLIDGGDLLTLVNDLYSYQSGITALAGGGLSGAPIMINNYSQIDTVATTNDSIALPPATPGTEVVWATNPLCSAKSTSQSASTPPPSPPMAKMAMVTARV